MSKQNRAIINYGNDAVLYIEMKRWDKEQGKYIPFDMTEVTDLVVSLTCSKHSTIIKLDYTIEGPNNEILNCPIDYRLLHTNAAYGCFVEGYDKDQQHFRFEMLPSELMLVISNTSGIDPNPIVQTIDIQARCGWGIQVDADLSNYYTKPQTDNLLDNKQDTLVSGTNIKTINNESILGEGNIEIQGGGSEQVQSDWDESDTEDPAYIKHKPDLSVYATQSQLGNYYDKGQTDGLLNNKVDTSTLVEDYYNKNTVNNLLDTKANTSDLNSYYDKTQTDTLLNQKANTSDLNTKQDTLVSGTNIKTINSQSVLGSGNIEITVPQQVQSDWNQTDNTAVDYIKNKPTIPDTSNFVQTTEANSANEVTANSLYNLNERLGSAEFSIKTIPTELQAQIDTLKSDVDEVSASTDAQFEDIDNEFKTSALILNDINDTKQDTLVSGTNIKTVNGSSLLGSGDITVGGGVQSDWNETDNTSLAYIQNKPSISDPGIVYYTNPTYSTKKGYVCKVLNDDSSKFTTNIGNNALVIGAGDGTTSSKKIKAAGDFSISLGKATKASGDYSLSQGYYTETQNPYEIGFGIYNKSTKTNTTFGDAGNTLFSVGNGNSTATHNAFEIRQNGDIYLNDGSHPISSTTNGLKVETASSAPSGTVPVTLAFDSTTNTLYIVQ